jgi:hypothetical protein
MFKGFLIVVLALLCAVLLDEYLTNGWYTDVAMAMLRQMRHSFRI